MTLSKLTMVANKFQKKLAQVHRSISPLDSMAPVNDPAKERALRSADPLDFENAKKELGALTDVSEYAATPSTSQPQKSIGPAPEQPQASSKPASLPADIRAKLDVGAPGLKGMILVTLLNDGGIRVDYNADRWKGGATALKRILVNALPGYKVGDVYGHMNPTWTTNYF